MVAAAADIQHVSTPAEIRSYYEEGREDGRLRSGVGLLEFARTQEILRRHLPPPPVRILDVGGGSGVHAAWLARDGYQVHLVDPIQLHVEQALASSRSQPEASFTAEIGDARRLGQADESYHAALLLGPLYHLTYRDDRLGALREARRVTRPGGSVFAAAISRFASVIDGLARGFLLEPGFREIAERDLVAGQHRNPTAIRGWFTTAYFPSPGRVA
jgi:ubiquinone/menaquinone biosynthesis C-methylase UbiE